MGIEQRGLGQLAGQVKAAARLRGGDAFGLVERSGESAAVAAASVKTQRIFFMIVSSNGCNGG